MLNKRNHHIGIPFLQALVLCIGLTFPLLSSAEIDYSFLDVKPGTEQITKDILAGVSEQIKEAQKQHPDKKINVIYLSGPITTGPDSIDDNIDKGVRATRMLESNPKKGEINIVISPYMIMPELNPGKYDTRGIGFKYNFSDASKAIINGWITGPEQDHKTFMKVWGDGVFASGIIDEVVMRDHYETSVGAIIEMGLFVAYEKPISFYRPTNDKKSFKLERFNHPSVAAQFEHTVLKKEATQKDVVEATKWALQKQTRAMVVRPEFMEDISRILKGSMTIPTSVIGFPKDKFSATEYVTAPTSEKLKDAITAIDGALAAGANAIELDMIIDVPSIKRWSMLKKDEPKAAIDELKNAKADIDAVITTVKEYVKDKGIGVRTKVILETSQLTPKEIEMASKVVRATYALAVKTNTGYGPKRTDEEALRDLQIMRNVVGNMKLIKSSGGGDKYNAYARKLWANLQGTSGTPEIVRHSWGDLERYSKLSSEVKNRKRNNPGKPKGRY